MILLQQLAHDVPDVGIAVGMDGDRLDFREIDRSVVIRFATVSGPCRRWAWSCQAQIAAGRREHLAGRGDLRGIGRGGAVVGAGAGMMPAGVNRRWGDDRLGEAGVVGVTSGAEYRSSRDCQGEEQGRQKKTWRRWRDFRRDDIN